MFTYIAALWPFAPETGNENMKKKKELVLFSTRIVSFFGYSSGKTRKIIDDNSYAHNIGVYCLIP